MTNEQIMRLVVETGVSLPTARKWARDPSSVQRAIRYALQAGCRVLGFRQPEPAAQATGTDG